MACGMALVVAACHGGSPSAPDSVNQVPRTYDVVGTVTEPVGVPIDQARVTLVDAGGRRSSVVTQADGSYSVRFGTPSVHDRGRQGRLRVGIEVGLVDR